MNKEIKIDGIWYRLDIDKQEAMVIKSQGDEYSNEIIIPSSFFFEGIIYRVTIIGEYAFEGCFHLKSVKLSNNITRISKNTFRDCPNLVSVIGGGSVKHIDDYAFCNCKNLSTFNIPNSVETIGNYAFEDCYHLNIILPQNLISIGKYAFEKCLLESIKIPKSVTSIDKCALQGCYSENDSIIVEDGNPIYDSRENCNAIIETKTNTLLIGGNSTIIPNSVKTIGENAFMNCFRNCNMWYSMTIPDGVECIEKHAFSGCYKIDSITIPDSVVTIGESAFNNCVNLGSVYINSLESWCNIDFGVGANPLGHKHFDSYNMGTAHLIVNGKLVHELNIPNTVKSIKNFAFERCSLTSVFIPENVTTIGIEAFAGCLPLKSIVISNGVTNIEQNAFCDCSLTSILIPKTIETIGEGAFQLCNEATYITILGSPIILKDAFAKCDKIRDVYCYSEKVVQADGAFGCIDLSLVTLHVPANMIDQYKNAMPWCSFGNIVPLQKI